MKILLTLAIMATTAQAEYNLPFAFKCGSEWVQGVGIGICASPTTLAGIKAKIPPVAGQIRALDCQQELVRQDFNTKIWKTGWWLWAKTIIIPSETPIVNLPINRQIQNCPIYVGVASYPDIGFQEAILLHTDPMDTFLEFSCAYGPWISAKNGVGSCSAFAGSTLRLRMTANPGIVNVIGSSCAINIEKEIKQQTIIEFDMPKDECILDILLSELPKAKRSRLLVLGKDPAKRELTNPLQIDEGDKKRIIKPLGAEMMGTEIFVGSKRVWSSAPKTDDSYHLDPSVDNEQGSSKWHSSAIACHNAYSGKLRSISGACYRLNGNIEVPFEVK